MKVICVDCGYVIDRDKIIEGKIVEEYKNIYGTRCPKCKKFNEPAFKEKELTEREIKIALLKEQVKDKLRNKLRR